MPAGFDAVAYRNNGGTWAVPIWDDMSNVRDATVNSPHTDLDATTRGSGGQMEHEAGLRATSVNFQMICTKNDLDYGTLRAAHLARTLVDMVFLTGPIAGVGEEGPRAEWLILTLDRNEPLDDQISVDFNVVPGKGLNSPEWMITT